MAFSNFATASFVPERPGLFGAPAATAASKLGSFDRHAVMEIRVASAQGDKRFWLELDGYHCDAGHVVFHQDGKCDVSHPMCSTLYLRKDDYVLWLPNSTIEALRDPFVNCPLKHANYKPIEDRNVSNHAPFSLPRLDRIEERIKTLEDAVSKLAATTTTAPTPTLPDGFKPLKDLIVGNIAPGTRVVHGLNPEIDFKIPVPDGAYAFVILFDNADMWQTKPLGAKFVNAPHFYLDPRQSVIIRKCDKFTAVSTTTRTLKLPDGFKPLKDLIVDDIAPGTRVVHGFSPPISDKIPVPDGAYAFVMLFKRDDKWKTEPIGATFVDTEQAMHRIFNLRVNVMAFKIEECSIVYPPPTTTASTLPDGFSPLKDLIVGNIAPGTRVVHGVNPEIDFKIPVPDGAYAFVVLYAGADKTQTKPIGAKFVDESYVGDPRYNTQLRKCWEFIARIRGPGLPDGFKLIKDMIVDEIPPDTRILSSVTDLGYRIPVPKGANGFIALYEDDDKSKSYPIAAKFDNWYEEAEMLRASGYNVKAWMF